MKTFYMKKAFLTLGFLLLIPVFVIAQTFTIEQSVTGNNRSDIRGQVFIPSEQDNGTGTITSTGPVYLTAFDVIYDAGAEAPTLYIYSSLPTDLTSLDDGTGGTLVGESTGKAAGTFPYTTYSFDFLELDKNTTYYALFRQDVQLEFGGSGAIEGPYTGGKMLVNTGTAVAENDYSALKFIGTFENTLPPHQGDVDALIALYNATDGANWTNKWDLNGSPYDWYGVTWEGSRVTEISLYNNNLSGVIPIELGNLSNLTYLELTYNSLSGSIPSELGDLLNLIYLKLSFNSLSGPIPVELGAMTNLQVLNLSYNDLSGAIPPTLGDLVNLTDLVLSDNSLNGSIPTALFKLSKLSNLMIGFNELSGSIPMEVGNLVNLTHLNFNYNSLSGSIPVEIGNLINLTTLTLENNSLTGPIPIEVSYLNNLQVLRLSNNNLNGAIPVELGALSVLNELSLHTNALTGSIPVQLGNLMNLTALILFDNSLSGEIPSELGSLVKLSRLYLNNNLFSEISFDISLLPALDELYLSNNFFDFADFEALDDFFSSIPDLVLQPQAKIEAPESVIAAGIGATVTLTLQTAGVNNQYEWFKDGVPVSEISTSPDLIIDDFQIEDTGLYSCKVTNPSVPSLTLYSEDIELTYSISFNESSPAIKKVDLTNFTAEININKAGTVHYVALPRGDGAPTAQQVIAGQNSLGEPVTESGNKVVEANTVTDWVISGLNLKNNMYDVYFVANDEGVSSSDVVLREVVYPIQFTAGPSIKERLLNGMIFSASTSRAGIVYYVASPSGSNVPTVQQVMDGNNALGEAAIASGSQSVEANIAVDVLIDGLEEATAYNFYFVAVDNFGTVSNVVQLSSFTVTGLAELFDQNQLKIYPIPASNQLFVELVNIPTYDITITDLNGQVHYSKHHEAGRAEIDIRHLTPGIYMLQLRSDDKSGWMKIIKE